MKKQLLFFVASLLFFAQIPSIAQTELPDISLRSTRWGKPSKDSKALLRKSAVSIKLDSTITFFNNPLTDEVTTLKQDEFHYTYNNNGLLISQIGIIYDTLGNTVVPARREKIEINSKGDLSVYEIKLWDKNTNIWVDEIRYDHHYNTLDLLDSISVYEIHPNTKLFSFSFKTNYYYNSSNKIDSLVTYYSDRKKRAEKLVNHRNNLGQIVRSDMFKYTTTTKNLRFISFDSLYYNALGLVESIITFAPDSVPSSLVEYEYDVDGNVTLVTKYTWVEEQTDFFPTEKTESEYTNGLETLVYSTAYVYDETIYEVPTKLSVMTSGLESAILVEKTWDWDNLDSTLTVIEYKYDNSQLSSEVLWPVEKDGAVLFDYKVSTADYYETFDEIKVYEEKYYYSQVVTNIIKDKESIGFNLYPNPAVSNLTVQLPTNDIYTLNMHHISGVSVTKEVSNSFNTINVETLPKGLYQINITLNGESVSKSKIVVE